MTTKAPTRPERPFRFTREQYHEMGRQGFFDGKRVELIFGEVVEMSPIGWLHRIGTGRVWSSTPWAGHSTTAQAAARFSIIMMTALCRSASWCT